MPGRIRRPAEVPAGDSTILEAARQNAIAARRFLALTRVKV